MSEKYFYPKCVKELNEENAILGEGNTYEEAFSDVKLAIRFHIESFGRDILKCLEIAHD